MRWPWCSRAMLDLLMAERDRQVSLLTNERDSLREELKGAREQMSKLTEHFTRIQRVENRMPEVPREAREEIEPMPSTLATYIGQWGSPKTQQMQVREARQRRQSGVPWAIVERDLRLKEQAPDGFAAAEAQHPAR